MNLADKRILIVDDDQTSIDVLHSLLSKCGVQLIGSVMDSSTLYEELGELTVPDAVFLDLEMPGVNGYALLELFRRTPNFAGVPIIAYTTHVSHVNEANLAGFHSFLGKPLNRHRFGDQLLAILSGEEVWDLP